MPDPICKHWLWCALGLQGVVGMMQRLSQDDVPVTPDAWALLKEQQARLQALLVSQPKRSD